MSSLHRPESFLSITILFLFLAVGGASASAGQPIRDPWPARKPYGPFLAEALGLSASDQSLEQDEREQQQQQQQVSVEVSK